MDFDKEPSRIEKLNYTLPQKLKDILDGFKRAIHKKNTSAVLIVDGRSGMGKTTLANQCGLYLDPNFSLEKLHYSPKTFLDGGEDKIGLAQATKGDVIVFDEALLLSTRTTLSKVNTMIIQAMSMIRSKNITVIFCVNSIFDIDKNLALHRADLLLSVYGDSLTDRGKFMAFFKGMDGTDRIKQLYLYGKKFYSYARPRSNFNAPFSSHFVLDSDEYEIKKQKAISLFLKDTTDNTHAHKVMIQRDNIIMWLRTHHKRIPAKKIAEVMGIETNLLYQLLKRVRDRKEL